MNSLQEIELLFERNLQSVDELIRFDKLVLDTCIDGLQRLNEKLKRGPFTINNPSYLAENTLKTIQNIRTNDSLTAKYLSMFNSCVVLQVSYFSSVLDDIFRHTAAGILADATQTALDFEALRRKNDTNFQNMQATTRAYKNFLNIDIKKDNLYNTIIIAQSARHAIVHALGLANETFIRQAELAKPRDIKHDFKLNQQLYFSVSELEYVKLAMLQFVSAICNTIKGRYPYLK